MCTDFRLRNGVNRIFTLIEKKNYKDEDLPKRRTISTILNKLGYRLRKVKKNKPLKKIPETDAIFHEY